MQSIDSGERNIFSDEKKNDENKNNLKLNCIMQIVCKFFCCESNEFDEDITTLEDQNLCKQFNFFAN